MTFYNAIILIKSVASKNKSKYYFKTISKKGSIRQMNVCIL